MLFKLASDNWQTLAQRATKFLGVGNTAKLEKIQHHAHKFIFKDDTSDYATLLAKANMPSLELSRLRCVAIEVFKVYNGLVPSMHLKNLKKTPTGTTLDRNTIRQGHSRTTKWGLHSFKTFGVHIWNNLQANIRMSTDLRTFKLSIKACFGLACKCTFCRHVSS